MRGRERERDRRVWSETYVLCVLNRSDWAKQKWKKRRQNEQSYSHYRSLQTATCTLIRDSKPTRTHSELLLEKSVANEHARIVQHFDQTTIQRKHEVGEQLRIYKTLRTGFYVSKSFESNVEVSCTCEYPSCGTNVVWLVDRRCSIIIWKARKCTVNEIFRERSTEDLEI